MTIPRQYICPPGAEKFLRRASIARRQGGIVLVITLIMLVVISLLAVTSTRDAASTESVAGNVRITEMATQAAEIALRHCESSVLNALTLARGRPALYGTTFFSANILPSSVTPHWQDMTIWDSASTEVYVLPLSMVNQVGMENPTYKRPPECMVEPLPVVPSGGTAVSTSSSFVITTRGFGPDVIAADAGRSRPVGSEVWLQSQIKFQ